MLGKHDEDLGSDLVKVRAVGEFACCTQVTHSVCFAKVELPLQNAVTTLAQARILVKS